MKKEIILIIGLPGSGKSYFLENEIPSTYFKVDDPNTLKEKYDFKKVNADLIAVADPLLSRKEVLENAIKYFNDIFPEHEIKKVYFENNLEKCLNNIKHRDDGRDIRATLNNLSKIYQPPEDALEIWQPPKLNKGF